MARLDSAARLGRKLLRRLERRGQDFRSLLVKVATEIIRTIGFAILGSAKPNFSILPVRISDLVAVDGCTLSLGGRIMSAHEGVEFWLQGIGYRKRFETFVFSADNGRFVASMDLSSIPLHKRQSGFSIIAVLSESRIRIALDLQDASSFKGSACSSVRDGWDWSFTTKGGCLLVWGIPPQPAVAATHLDIGVAGLTVHLRRFGEVPDGPYRLVLRHRRRRYEYRTPFELMDGLCQVRVDAARLLENFAGKPWRANGIWNFSVEAMGRETRVSCGVLDFEDPANILATRHTAVRTGTYRQRIRPYWSRDGYLSVRFYGNHRKHEHGKK